MNLSNQTYQIYDRGKIELVSHESLVWVDWQVIRLPKDIFRKVNFALENQKHVSLINKYNSINNELIRSFFLSYSKIFSWKILEILSRNDKWPILNWSNLKGVRIDKMWNINLDELDEDFLELFYINFVNQWWKLWLINWLSSVFYSWSVTPDDFLQDWKLFYRLISTYE